MTDQSTAIWLRGERARRGRAPEHTRGEIAAAAVRLADRQGLAAVTMRALARVIGTGAASLYRYVATRDELVELMVDEVNGEFELERRPDASWLDQMVDLAHQARDIYRRHPWMIEALDTTPTLGPHGCSYLEHALATLAVTGAGGRTRLEAIGVFSGLVRLLCKAERDRQQPGPPSARMAQRNAYLSSVAASGEHPHLAAAFAETSEQSSSEGPQYQGIPAAPSDGQFDGQFDRIVRRTLLGMLHEGDPD
jgi:AcrR family transcriptional regulator